LVATLGDAYPSIRVLARRSLLALDDELRLGVRTRIEAYDPLAPPDVRTKQLYGLIEALPPILRVRLGDTGAAMLLKPDGALDLERVTSLLNLQTEHVISIGE